MAAAEARVTNAPAIRPSPLKALAMLAGIVVMVAGYLLVLGSLGNSEAYAGFVFLLSWALIEHGKIERLPHAIVGSAAGLALGFMLQFMLTGPMGTTGGYVFGALVLPVIYFHITGRLQLFINASTMIFLLVGTIPHVLAHGNFQHMAVALAIGIVYFGIILGVVSRMSPQAADEER